MFSANQGHLIVGFAHRLEFVCSHLHSELEAMRYGINQPMGVRKVIIDSDCLIAVKPLTL